MTRKVQLALAVACVNGFLMVGCSKDAPTAPSAATGATVAIENLVVTGEANPSGSGWSYYATFNFRETSGRTGATVNNVTFTLADGRASSSAVSIRVGAGAIVPSGAQTISDASGPSLSSTMRLTIAFADDNSKAGQGSATANVTAPVRYTLDGIVTNASNGARLANAALALSDSTGKQLSTRSDGNGYFVFTGVAGGRVTLAGAASGFDTNTSTFTINESGSHNVALQPTVYPVEYRLTGSARHCSATFQNASGGTSQFGVSIPYSYTWPTARINDFLYFSCQIDQANDSGTLTVAIYKNGVFYRSGVAVGFPNIATASGSY